MATRKTQREDGLVFPVSGAAGDDQAAPPRSTSDAGRATFAAAAAAIDPDLAARIEAEENWRGGYLQHVADLVTAQLRDPAAADAVPQAGLDALHDRFGFVRDDEEVTLRDACALPPRAELQTVEVRGRGRGQPLAVPYRGAELTGDVLRRQLDRWVADGVVEPSFASAISLVVSQPDWLDLSDLTIVVLGAASEMGPLPSLARWGATIVAVDRPRPHLWGPVLATLREGAGRALVPVRELPAGGADADDDAIAGAAGADLTTDLPAVAAWLRQLDGPRTLGSYVYAHGATHVLVSLAADALAVDQLRHGQATGAEVRLAGLLTPTDVYAVPGTVVAEAHRRRDQAARLRRLARTATRGRTFEPAYADPIETPGGATYGVADGLVPQQGPNYALAKRLQQWRFRQARRDGVTVSANVAPATRTRSVTANRILAAAYAGAHRFDVEIFEPDTSTVLLAALLVHDLRDPQASGNPQAELDHPLELFSQAAAHGGMWRQPYVPRSVLPLAAVLGLPKVLRT